MAFALVWETYPWPWSRAGCWTKRQRQERLDWDPSKSQTSKRAAAADPQFVSREHVVVPVGRLSSRRRDRDLASRIGLAWSSAQLERRGLAAQAQAATRQLSAACMHFALACVVQSIAELGRIQSSPHCINYQRMQTWLKVCEQCCELSACLCNLLLYKLTAALLSVYLQCTQTWLSSPRSSLTSASQYHCHHHRCVISCGTNTLLLFSVNVHKLGQAIQV